MARSVVRAADSFYVINYDELFKHARFLRAKGWISSENALCHAVQKHNPENYDTLKP